MFLDILWHWYIRWWPFSWLLCTSEHSLHRCRCRPRCRCTCKVSLLKLYWSRVVKMLPSFQGVLVSRTQRQVTKKGGMMNDPAVLGCGLNESKKTTNLGGGNSIFFRLGKSSNLTSIFISLRLMPPAFAGLEISSSMARSTTKSSSNNNSTILSIASSMARSTTKSNSNSSNNQQQQ